MEACREVLQAIAAEQYRFTQTEVQLYTDWLTREGTILGYFSDCFGSELPAEENNRSYAEAIANRLDSRPRTATRPEAA